MSVVIYPPSQQAVGAFDRGKITEQKPIGFSGEGSAVKRIGPLFYWAWAKSKAEGYIPLHPHKAFEIITYVIQGKAEHGDTLGTNSVVGAGGLQVMQTGSGVSHEERFIGPDMEGFQIWFEPSIQEALTRPPTYHQFDTDAFPVTQEAGITIKTIVGASSPVDLVANIKMWDVELAGDSEYKHVIPAGYTLATLALRGDGTWEVDNTLSFSQKDLIVIEAETEKEVILKAKDTEALRMILIEVPTETDYPLYRK
jgi:redox-sensitive bicupin YhaK (pirin superfamily)